MALVKTDGEITKELVECYQSLDDLITCGLPFHLVESYAATNYNASEDVIADPVADLMLKKYSSEIDHYILDSDNVQARREGVVNALILCCENLHEQFEGKLRDTEMTINEYESGLEKSPTKKDAVEPTR